MESSKGDFLFATDAGEAISWPTMAIDMLVADAVSQDSKNSRLKSGLVTKKTSQF